MALDEIIKKTLPNPNRTPLLVNIQGSRIEREYTRGR